MISASGLCLVATVGRVAGYPIGLLLITWVGLVMAAGFVGFDKASIFVFSRSSNLATRPGAA